MLIKEILKVLNKCKDIMFSWIKTFNIVKMSTLPKLIYRFNTNPTKISIVLFVETSKLIMNFICKSKLIRISKAVLKNNS